MTPSIQVYKLCKSVLPNKPIHAEVLVGGSGRILKKNSTQTNA